jgi:hypothetical protein
VSDRHVFAVWGEGGAGAVASGKLSGISKLSESVGGRIYLIDGNEGRREVGDGHIFAVRGEGGADAIVVGSVPGLASLVKVLVEEFIS